MTNHNQPNHAIVYWYLVCIVVLARMVLREGWRARFLWASTNFFASLGKHTGGIARRVGVLSYDKLCI